MPKSVVLTRYLYIRDEVELAFINALVSKSDFDEVIFWMSELYESGFREELWSLIWRCFYDFYAIKNPRQESAYYRHYEEWRIDKNISHLIFVCKNMHIKSADPSVFIFRMRVECDPLPKKTPITGRRPKWVSEFDHEAQPFLVSLDKNIQDNIVYYFKTLPVEVLRENLVRYFKEKYAVVVDFDKIDSVWNGTRYDRRHILMAIYHGLMIDEAEINTGNMFVSVDDDELSYWREVNTIEEDIPNYKVLHYKRDYAIPKMVGSFNLARYHIKQTDGFTELNKILWYHWEYFAYRCPLWRKRIIEHSGEAVDDKKRVGFSRYYDDSEESASDEDISDEETKGGTGAQAQAPAASGAGEPILIPISNVQISPASAKAATKSDKKSGKRSSSEGSGSGSGSGSDDTQTENDNIGVEELKKNIRLAREKNYKYCIETFYEMYGYEPDEQTADTQDKVRGEGGAIEPSTLSAWLEATFDTERTGGFADSVGVRYEYIGVSM